MAARFQEGELVQLDGVLEKVADLRGEGTGQFLEESKVQAQLVHYDRQASKWIAMTFSGQLVKAAASSVSQLAALPGVDFVLGPRSDESVLAQEMAHELVNKGYFVCQSMLSPSAVRQMERIAAKDLTFSRMSREFEPHFLGRDSREKTALIDFGDAPRSILESPFRDQDVTLTSMFQMLKPLLLEHLGLRVTSTSSLMVRQTFADDDEEALFPAALRDESSRESCLNLLKRRQLCAMHFLGPLTGSLQLIPRAGCEDIEIEAAPGRLVLFLTERYQYSHSCAAGATMTLQSWFLSQQPQYVMGNYGGDLEVLGAMATGPPPPEGESVAVTGISTCLGADGKDYACCWLMFNKAAADTVVKTPITRWDTEVYCIPGDIQAAQASGKSYTYHQGFVDGIEFFDNKFFGIGTSEASSMDPNQRKALECAYELVAQGGHTLKSLQRDPAHIGVFVGISGSEWSSVPHPCDAAGCGGAEAIISNRCNFNLNLKGVSQTINTACSSGLVAMHSGKLHLKYRDFDPMEACVTVGCQLAYSPYGFIGCCSGGMLSLKGRCFTFDYSADGYLRGEGCSGVYLVNAHSLKPEAHALVAGSQANQDGRSASITAPNGPSQEKCIKAVFREASISCTEVDCFECHGTGTSLGDPIEVGAFKRIYTMAPRATSLLVTSSKTNLGHLEGGAGMAGFIKCCLQVSHAECSPNLHLREQNPHLDVAGFPALFTTEGVCCAFESCYTGVSSFGFGGTNAHAMAYGKNVSTTRKVDNRDLRRLLLEKIMQAPPPEVFKHSESPEEWETTGRPVTEDKIGKMYQVEMTADGRTVWREVVTAMPSVEGRRFSLYGSFNRYSFTPMQMDKRIPNLFFCDISIGGNGEEVFNVVCDEDHRLSYFPSEQFCQRKVTKVVGPQAAPSKASVWSIKSEPGTRFRVEFHITAHSTSLTWMRMGSATIGA